MAFLEVRHICKSFGRTEVLKGIDFSLEKGKVLSIIGSSGSGKTTLLRSMNYLELPQKGTVSVGGEILFDYDDPHKFSDEELRRKRLHFGMVFQNFNLFPQYNVLDNCTLAMDLLAKGKARQAKQHFDKAASHRENQQIASDILASVGLSAKLKNYPCELSGGQCQRVAIARALCLKPDILCFDEPTSALDPELTGEVLRVIKGLKSSDSTMIIVTHEMEFARNVSDKVIFMADGVIEEQGTPDEVFGAPKSEKTKSFLAKSLESI